MLLSAKCTSTGMVDRYWKLYLIIYLLLIDIFFDVDSESRIVFGSHM